MKIFNVIILLALMTLFSCQKKENDPLVTQQEVTFSANRITDPGALKSTSGDIKCKDDLSVDYAMIVIDNNYYFMDVYMLGGKVYTQAIKLDVPSSGSKDFYVNEFYLMRMTGVKDPIPPPGGPWVGDDQIIFATPTATSIYKDYVSDPVDIKITVTAFQKVEIPIDVLCYEEAEYQNFGFDWFSITEIIVRQQCFFGDICVDDPSLYTSSLYNFQANGVKIDMPAIFYIEVTKNGVPVPFSPFGNSAWFGEGAPLCVQYSDNLSIPGEHFKLDLYVLIRDISGVFYYAHYFTWEFDDDYMIPTGGDGIIDFVIGDCNLIPPDIIIPDSPPPPPDPQEPVCETAFAYGGTYATCFLTIPNLNNDRWGWTNGPLSLGTYTFPIYAAAGQCDLDNGTLVGTLTAQYTDDGNVSVTYNIPDLDLAMYSIHIYVGQDILPLKNGKPTVSPGQYPWVEEITEGTNSYSHTFTGLSGTIYIIGHAVVCGNYE